MFKKLTIAFLAAMACVHAQEKDITEIDPNFRQATVGNREVRFADVRKAPFVLTGFAFRKSEDEPFYREKGGQGMMMPLRDGDVLDLGGRPLKVIHIPGHTPGSVALLDVNARVLISGDSVQNDNIFMFGPRRNIKEFIRSLERLNGLKDSFSEIWPSHGSFPVAPDLIDKLVEGARQIVDGKVSGTQAVHRDTPVIFYEFPYAGFFCDL